MKRLLEILNKALILSDGKVNILKVTLINHLLLPHSLINLNKPGMKVVDKSKMKIKMVKITYIFHDCFAVELPDLTMVFDFWKDPTVKEKCIPSFILNADKKKPMYVLVSHHHKDHFSKQIFEWEKIIPEIKFIISKDVARFARHLINAGNLYQGFKPSPERIVVLDRGERYEDNLIKVEAFGSTDIGNSYYIEAFSQKESPISIFHSGDLNAWIWKDESSQEEVNEALNGFNNILQEIKSRHKSIDYVMFPVDSRIGTDFFTGARKFVRTINVKHFFPMHFGLGEDEKELRKRALDAADVMKYAEGAQGEYICLQTPYSTFLKI